MGNERPDADMGCIAGRYDIERQLGQGGMATVYRVVDRGNGSRMALKLLREDAQPAVREALEAEYRLLAGLRHPSIVRAFDFGSHEGRAFYTMELLEGEDLGTRSPVPWREVCEHLRDAASVLGVLHARRMVHRDLSPRNLWRTPSGRIKLLDFGTVAPFGVVEKVIGTAPFVPPEATEKRELDQRSDLYSLGALAYWLLTGGHAFRAQRIQDLPVLWQDAPAAPSRIAAMVDESLPQVPAKLDELVLSLLSLDPAERPIGTVEVVDRLNQIAGLQPEAQDVVVRGYLGSQEFVGRVRERAAVERRLQKAADGKPTCVMIQGSEGMGRSRLLSELSTTARVFGAASLQVGREAGQGPYAAAAALACELLEQVGELAMPLARVHAPTLAGLSDGLAEKLGAVPADAEAKDEAMDARARKQRALAALFQGVSRERTLALLVDDVDLLDEESQALLATLVRAERGHRICVVSTCGAHASDEDSHSLDALRSSARRLAVGQLSADEMRAMLASIFGDVPYLERLAARLHQLSEGNPGRCMLQVEHLVHLRVIQYAEGTWTLPAELPETDLPATLRDGLLATLDRLDPSLRRFARRLAVPDHGALTVELAGAAGDLPADQAARALRDLRGRGVLSMSSEGFAFEHAVQREALHGELDDVERAAVHAAFARTLVAQRRDEDDSVVALRAGLHWLRAGEAERAEPLIFEAGQAYMQGSVAESLRHAAPMFADAVELLESRKRDDHVLLLPLAVLAYAGYFVDRRYAHRYGPRAIQALSGALRLPLARRLRPFIGGKLSMIFALIVAGIGLRRRAYVPRLAQLIYCLVSAATTTAAAAAVTLHPTAVREHSRVLGELSVLRSAHVVRFLARFTEAIALISESRVAEAQAIFREVATTLEDPDTLPDMPATTRAHYLAHSHALHGLYDAWSCKAESLASADRAESFGPFHAMWAQQVRAVYHGLHGELGQARECEAEVERFAIQLGSVWQVELWSPVVTFMSLRGDAVATKRAAEQMQAYAETLPHFAIFADFIRAAYLVMRGSHRAAVDLLDRHSNNDGIICYSVAKGWLATALNQLRQHGRARDVCRSALDSLGVNRTTLLFSLRLEVELALAEAGLGNHEQARMQLDALIESHLPAAGPIVGGYLRMERVRLALKQRDLDTAAAQLDLATDLVLPLGLSSMTKQVAELRNALAEARGERTSPSARRVRPSLVLASKMLEQGTQGETANRAETALRTALELTSADRGFLLLGSGELGPNTGPGVTEEVLEWARMEQQIAGDEEETGDVGAGTDSEVSTGLAATFQDARYRIVHLWRPASPDLHPMASLVLGHEAGEPDVPAAEVTTLLARFLADGPRRAS